MRNTSVKNQSHAISLSFATHSFGTIFSGIIIFFSAQFMQAIDEGNILLGISIFGFFALYYLLQMKIDITPPADKKMLLQSYDWLLILQAIVPTLIIAIGAGLTIPFINLFFFHNFSVDSSGFAMIGGLSSFLVAIFSLLVPNLKSRFGFKGITYTQIIAVLALVALATTEFLIIIGGLVHWQLSVIGSAPH